MKFTNLLTLILLLLLNDYSFEFKKIRNRSGSVLMVNSNSKLNIASRLRMSSRHRSKLNTIDDGPEQPNCSNSYFQYPFACLSTDGLPTQTSMIPDNVLAGYTKVYQSMYALGSDFNFCLGDLTGDSLHEEEQISCQGIPLNPDNTYAALGGIVYDYDCGVEEPQNVSACVAFDTCGTFAVSISGGIVRCVTGMFPGIGTIVTAIAEFIEFVSFGISIDKQFTMPLQIFTYTNSSGAGVVDVTTQGHFYLSAGLAFPQQIFGDNEALKEAVSLDVTGTFMIDFGNYGANQIESINNYNSTQNSDSISFVQNLLTNGEVAANLNGTLSLNLNELTHGVLPNLEFDIGEISALIASGGGASGQPAGFYLYAESNLDFFMDLLSFIFEKMANLFGLGNVSMPNISSGDNFGIFINENFGGFTFGFTLLDPESISCVYNFSSDSGSCGVQGWFLTFVYQAGKWLVNEVEDLWGDVKQVYGYFDEGFNFVGKELEIVGEDIAAGATVAADDVASATVTAANAVASATTTAAVAVASAATTAANAVANTAVTVADDVGSGVVTAADDIGDFFSDIFGGGCSSSNNNQSGGYYSSCSGCYMMNSNSNNYPHYLQCNCKDVNGNNNQSNIDVSQCFGNVNGIIAWRKTGCYPAGYYQSCLNCQVNGSVLSCICKQGSSNNYYDMSASVDMNNFITNSNGNLKCS